MTKGRINFTGQTLELDGRGDYGYVAPSDAHDLGAGSIQLTFNADTVHGTRTLFSRDSAGFDGGGHLTAYVRDGKLIVRLQSDDRSYHVASDAGAIKPHEDVDFRFDFGPGGMKLFIDGRLVDTDAYAGGLGGNDEPITLGASQAHSSDGRADNLGGFFDGTIKGVSFEGAAPATAATRVLLHEAFDGGASMLTRNDFALSHDALVTNGHEDGEAVFQEVDFGGQGGTIQIDAKVLGSSMEASGRYADFVRFELVEADGTVTVLDEFRGNGHTLTGSETGQRIDRSGETLSWDVGGDVGAARLRIVTDISASREKVSFDDLKITTVVPDAPPAPGPECLLEEDFDGGAPSTVSNDFRLAGSALVTDGHNDGEAVFQEVDFSGRGGTVEIDAKVVCGGFEAGGRYADFVRFELVRADGTVIVLDEFRGNGDTLTGSQTGQTISFSEGGLSWDVGTDVGAASLRIVSDISAASERLCFDDLKIMADAEAPTPPGMKCVVDFDGTGPDGTPLAAGDIVSRVDGVTVEAFRIQDINAIDDAKDGGAAPRNAAMIFDTNEPTGGDDDLATATQNNVLIISEDFDGSDPDDNASGRPGFDSGGVVLFTFDDPVFVQSLGYVEFNFGGSVQALDADGNVIRTVRVAGIGDNNVGTIQVGAAGVSQLRVEVKGSGGIDDLVFYKPAPTLGALEGRYFCDENGNDRDDAEPGVAGATVELLLDGQVVGTTTTDGQGAYRFEGLVPDDGYSVRFEDPATAADGKAFVAPDVGDDADDSDVNPSNGTTGTVTVVAGETTSNVDAGVADPGTASVGDTVFFDADRDGVRDAGEAGVAGVTVTLTGAGTDGVLGTADDTTATDVTDQDGQYLFEDLDAGDYKVTFNAAATGLDFTAQSAAAPGAVNDDSDADQTTGTTGTITLAVGEAERDVDAGLVDPGTASVGDTVWFDANRNGRLDASEQGADGVTVELLDAQGDVIGTQQTVGGRYLFDGLDAGTYAVRFGTLPGFEFTDEGAAAADAANGDSDADLATGETDQFVLTVGEAERDVDAGLVASNGAPMPMDDAGLGCADEEIVVDALANDADPDRDALTITAVDGQAIVEGGTVQTSAGTFVTLRNGQLVFDGEDAYAALDIGETDVETVSYTVSDGLDTATAEVEVTFCGDANSLESLFAKLPDDPNGSDIGFEVASGLATPFPEPIGEFGFDLRLTVDDVADMGGMAIDLNGAVFTSAYCLAFFDPTTTAATLDAAPVLAGDLFGARDALDDPDLGQLFDASQFSTVNNQLAEDNFDLIQYIVAQGFEDDPQYTGWEVQYAIWELTDPGIRDRQGRGTEDFFENFPNTGSLSDVDAILADAFANGEGFTPSIDDGIVGLVVRPNPVSDGNQQPFIIGLDIETYDCLC